jgi:S1-C subfamily serine protease
MPHSLRHIKLRFIGMLAAVLGLIGFASTAVSASGFAQATAATDTASTVAPTATAAFAQSRFPVCPPGARPAPAATGAPTTVATVAPTVGPQQTTAFIGISVRNVARCGAIVAAVRRNSPAATSGLRVADVIVAVNGTAITGIRDLFAAVSSHNPGDVLTLTVHRRVVPARLPRQGPATGTVTPTVTPLPQIARNVVELDIQVTLAPLPTATAPATAPAAVATTAATAAP